MVRKLTNLFGQLSCNGYITAMIFAKIYVQFSTSLHL